MTENKNYKTVAPKLNKLCSGKDTTEIIPDYFSLSPAMLSCNSQFLFVDTQSSIIWDLTHFTIMSGIIKQVDKETAYMK